MICPQQRVFARPRIQNTTVQKRGWRAYYSLRLPLGGLAEKRSLQQQRPQQNTYHGGETKEHKKSRSVLSTYGNKIKLDMTKVLNYSHTDNMALEAIIVKLQAALRLKNKQHILALFDEANLLDLEACNDETFTVYNELVDICNEIVQS